MVEGARLESEYTPKAYRGFESLPLRHPVLSYWFNRELTRFWRNFARFLFSSVLQRVRCELGIRILAPFSLSLSGLVPFCLITRLGAFQPALSTPMGIAREGVRCPK